MAMRRPTRWSRLSVLSFQFSVLVVPAFFGGCVDRTLTIRSDPPGAAVVLNGEDAGIAPARVRFETYGVYEVLLSAPGHRRLRAQVPVEPPWYERFPLDFFAETLWPFMIHDDHSVTLSLEPLSQDAETGLDAREQLLRGRVLRGEGAAPESAPEGK